MLKMCFPSATIDEDVIEEEKDKFPEIWFENVVHKALKSRGGITKTKWHDQEFIVAFMSSESSLGYVDFLHADLVVTGVKIQLREKLSPVEFIQQIIHHWNGKFIFDCELIEGPEVRTHP